MIERNKKKYILAIETTGKICGVAISNSTSVLFESNLDSGLNHSVTLFDNISSGVKKLGISFSNISLIKVSSGPGSFTGIRIGISTALGISAPNNIPVEYIDTLDSLFHNVNIDTDYTLTMIDARASRVYLGFYDNMTNKKLVNDLIISINDLIMLLNKYFGNKDISFLLIGDGALKYKDVFNAELKISFVINRMNNELSAKSLMKTTGIISKEPIINYMLASKAEREHND